MNILNAITDKYIHCKNIEFNDNIINNDIDVGDDDITLILGRSMM